MGWGMQSWGCTSRTTADDTEQKTIKKARTTADDSILVHCDTLKEARSFARANGYKFAHTTGNNVSVYKCCAHIDCHHTWRIRKVFSISSSETWEVFTTHTDNTNNFHSEEIAAPLPSVAWNNIVKQHGPTATPKQLMQIMAQQQVQRRCHA